MITCTDSGGPLELVRAGENGWIIAPDPASLAAAIGEAAADAALAERLGVRGHQDIRDLTWPAVVKKLVIV